MVKLQLKSWLFVLLVSCFGTSGAWADNLSPLTEKEIKLWISSYQALEAWSDKYEERIEQHDTDDGDQKTTVESILKPLKAAGLYDEADKVVREQGFSSVEHWAEVALKIVNASLSLAVEQYSGKPDNNAPAGDKKLIKQYEKQLKEAADKAAQAKEAKEAEEAEMADEEAMEAAE